MAEVEFVKELSGFQGRACLVKAGGEFFAVSSVNAMFTGPETLVFRADENGEVASFMDVAGGRGLTREEAMADLGERIDEGLPEEVR